MVGISGLTGLCVVEVFGEKLRIALVLDTLM